MSKIETFGFESNTSDERFRKADEAADALLVILGGDTVRKHSKHHNKMHRQNRAPRSIPTGSDISLEDEAEVFTTLMK